MTEKTQTQTICTHACVRYINHSEDKYKNWVANVEDIYLSKSSNDNIVPKSVTDFDSSHEYYVYYRSCDTRCTKESKCCSLYKAIIVCLGCKYMQNITNNLMFKISFFITKT